MQIKNPFSLNDNLIKLLFNRHNSKAVVEMQRLGRYPIQDHMRKLIETSFWATLGKEEGQVISFSLLFCSPDDYTMVDPLVFAEPVPFDIENLVKLSLSLNSSMQFGVYPEKKKQGELKIWGFGRRALIGNSTVRSFGAGRIVVSLGQHSMLITPELAEFLLTGKNLSSMGCGKNMGFLSCY